MDPGPTGRGVPGHRGKSEGRIGRALLTVGLPFVRVTALASGEGWPSLITISEPREPGSGMTGVRPKGPFRLVS